MDNEFDRRLKNIEKEILNLKTSHEYTSVKNARYSASTQVYTGLYKITYENTSEKVFSLVYSGDSGSNWGRYVWDRTPVNNEQVIEVNTTIYNTSTQQYETINAPVAVVSNKKVLSIVRL